MCALTLDTGHACCAHGICRADSGKWEAKAEWSETGKCTCAGAAQQKKAEMDELLVPPDLPIEMIAEEVKESWRLKEVHVEKLMQKVSLPCHPSVSNGHETHP